MIAFDDIRPGSRLRGLDAAGIAEVVQVARFRADALNLVFRVNGRVGERLVYRAGLPPATAIAIIGRGGKCQSRMVAHGHHPLRCGEPQGKPPG
jgi:hypothetical protein